MISADGQEGTASKPGKTLNAPAKVSKLISGFSMTAIPALTLSHQVTQHLFRKLDITAEWTGFDDGRAIVCVTGLAQIGNAHQYSVQIAERSHTSDVYSHDAVLVVLVLESQGAGGYNNSSNNAFASLRSNVSKPSVNQL